MIFPTNEKSRSFHTTALKNKQNNSSKSISKSQSKVDKSALVKPADLLDMLCIRYWHSIAGLTVYCPFHKNGQERKPSLMMNPRDGHYRCFTCGKKGGDVIAFYRAVTGAGFKQTLKELGVCRG